jgi:hypothetical protein
LKSDGFKCCSLLHSKILELPLKNRYCAFSECSQYRYFDNRYKPKKYCYQHYKLRKNCSPPTLIKIDILNEYKELLKTKDEEIMLLIEALGRKN